MFIKECFNTKGRWNRKKYWLYPLGFGLLIYVAFFIFVMLFSSMLSVSAISMIGTAVYILFIYVIILTYIKRLRDLDKNPWMTILMFVPLANIYLAIICGFIKGTVGPNKYGDDPLGGEAQVVVVENTPNTTTVDKKNDVTEL